MMNKLKRYAGLIWIMLGPTGMYYLVQTAASEIAKNPGIDTQIQWGVFIVVFLPIVIGFVLFGVYALTGNYDHLPEDSTELDDYDAKPI